MNAKLPLLPRRVRADREDLRRDLIADARRVTLRDALGNLEREQSARLAAVCDEARRPRALEFAI